MTIVEGLLALFVGVAAAFGAVGDAYQTACEDAWGGAWVNDNPTFYQSYSCQGGTPPSKA
jgi:hypothetical protein